jgi:hypothetical protein
MKWQSYKIPSLPALGLGHSEKKTWCKHHVNQEESEYKLVGFQ